MNWHVGSPRPKPRGEVVESTMANLMRRQSLLRPDMPDDSQFPDSSKILRLNEMRKMKITKSTSMNG